jgi:hypothetical protein
MLIRFGDLRACRMAGVPPDPLHFIPHRRRSRQDLEEMVQQMGVSFRGTVEKVQLGDRTGGRESQTAGRLLLRR